MKRERPFGEAPPLINNNITGVNVPVEEVVDSNLNKFMNQDLPTTNKRIDPTTDPEFDDEEDIDPNSTAACSDVTRNRIMYFLSKGLDQSGAAGMTRHFEVVGKMKENAAREYLRVLQYIHARSIDDSIVEGFIDNACSLTMNPDNTDCKERAKKDHYIRECVATGLNDLLGQIGSLAGIVVFAFYVFSSWNGNKFVGQNEKDQTSRVNKEKETSGRVGGEINKEKEMPTRNTSN